MRLNVIAISIEDPADHVVAAVLSELLNMTFGDGELTPPPPPHEGIDGATPRAGTAPPSPSLASTPPAAGDNWSGATPTRAAAVRAGSPDPSHAEAQRTRRDPVRSISSAVSAPQCDTGSERQRKPGMLATEQERKHFQNMHGAAVKAEPRIINSGQVKAALLAIKPGDELVVSPPPRKTNGIQKMINEMRRAGTIDKRVCVEQDRETRTVRIAWYEDDDDAPT